MCKNESQNPCKIIIADVDSIGGDMDFTIYQEAGDCTYYPDKITPENAAERLKGAQVLVVNKSRLFEPVLSQAPDLKLICVFATGYDNVDTEYCKAHGIALANVKGYSTPSVAQHTIAMLLYLMEHMKHYDDFVKSGAYAAQEYFCCLDIPFRELDGKTWGIVGMGNIGRAVAKIAEAFGAKVITYSTSGRPVDPANPLTPEGYEQVSFEELLRRSDVVSLHCPLTDKTRNLMNAETLSQMKPTAILLNVARGGCVNAADLTEALEAGTIAAAGLDVLDPEPMEKDCPLLRIQDSSKLIVTPHLAWASTESRIRCLEEVKQNILAWERGEVRNIIV